MQLDVPVAGDESTPSLFLPAIDGILVADGGGQRGKSDDLALGPGDRDEELLPGGEPRQVEAGHGGYDGGGGVVDDGGVSSAAAAAAAGAGGVWDLDGVVAEAGGEVLHG